MTENKNWLNLLLLEREPSEIWRKIADELLDMVRKEKDHAKIHQKTVFPDRILAEAAYDLWEGFITAAPKASNRLDEWCAPNPALGKAVLILDALSIREIPILERGAEEHDIPITNTEILFSEAPAATCEFAQALGAVSRSKLQNDGKGNKFKLFGGDCVTDLFNDPFADVPVGADPNLVYWHSFIDDNIHNATNVNQFFRKVEQELRGESFWCFIDKLRQGRKLVITSDHGYAEAAQFSMEFTKDDQIADYLKSDFGKKRYTKNPEKNQSSRMPPICTENPNNGYRMITGQRKWKIPSGFPTFCHGGLSLLETAVPWIEIEAKN